MYLEAEARKESARGRGSLDLWRTCGSAATRVPDHVLILGEQHLRSVLTDCAQRYNAHRPHQSLQEEPPLRQPSNAIDITARIERRQVLSGLISEYRRAA